MAQEVAGSPHRLLRQWPKQSQAEWRWVWHGAGVEGGGESLIGNKGQRLRWQGSGSVLSELGRDT